MLLPELGESVTEGTVTRWLKSVGDEVAVDEALLEISTDKVDTEIPSPFAGVLQEILVQEDETVAVGSALARIGDAAAAPAPAAARPPAPAPAPSRRSSGTRRSRTAAAAAPLRPPLPGTRSAAPAPARRLRPLRPLPRPPMDWATTRTRSPTSLRWCVASRSSRVST